jgi:hypothetical protein
VNKLIAFYLLVLTSTTVFPNENSLWKNVTENLRLAIDLSIRPQFDVKNDHFSHIESVSFDLHKIRYC